MRHKGWLFSVVMISFFGVAGCSSPNASVQTSQHVGMMKSYPSSTMNLPTIHKGQDTPIYVGKFIPGLNVQTILTNVENQWDLKFKLVSNNDGSYVYEGRKIDSATGATLGCNVFFYSQTQISAVNFAVDASSAENKVSDSQLYELASGFLGYGATLPYSGSAPAEASNWAYRVSASLQNGSVTKKIGNITLGLTHGANGWYTVLDVEPLPI